MVKDFKGVDFSYSFAPPHRITLSRPQSSNKTLADLYENMLRLSWSYHSLMEKTPNTWDVPTIDWIVESVPNVNGKCFDHLTGRRFDSGAPGFIAEGNLDHVAFSISGIATAKGDAFKVEFNNTGDDTAVCSLICEHKNGWVISNPAWIDGKNANTLMAMENGRPDRLLVMALGADRYPLDMSGVGINNGNVPLTQMESQKHNPAKSLIMEFSLPPKSQKSGWLIRPYESYEKDIPSLLSADWKKETASAMKEWDDLLSRGARPIIPDKSVEKAFSSCLSDIFVMSEPLRNGYMGISCGTEVYRSTNSFEPCISVMLLDELGYIKEANAEMTVHLDGQGKDGNWSDPEGWGHHMWGAAGLKAWLIMEHYELTKDIAFLENMYPRMLKATLWQNAMRNTTKTNPASPYYGLMPRGMGDGGLMNGNDYFGVFYPHNCLSVFADKMTLKAAEILGKEDDLLDLHEIYQNAVTDLLASLRKGAIKEEGYSWIPGTANKTSGSSWGSLFSFYPCGILSKDDPLITGTLKHIEKNKSEGGQPLGTGWMLDGCWVAISLDNLSETYLAMEDGDSASQYLYSSLNHATPFITWCEERGGQPNTQRCSGDRQHLWTPLAVCKYLRDALVLNQNEVLHLALGIPREWLSDGCQIGIEHATTYFGKISYKISRTGDKITVTMNGDSEILGKKLIIHLRTPEAARKFKIESILGGRATVIGEKVELIPGKTNCIINIDID